MEDLRRFAVALDEDDFPTVLALLEPDAVYETHREGVLHGPDAIVESFRKNSEWGHAHIDSVRFSHKLDPSKPDRILFIDELEHRGEHITHEITMYVRFSERGLVEFLKLEYAPGELERLEAFFKRAGIA